MKFKFERIIIWQRAMTLGERINKIAYDFPASENINLTAQIRRAADSIALNIAEGSIAQSNPEFKRFIGYAIRSLAEVVTCLKKAATRNYLSINEHDELYIFSYNLMNMMVAFRRNLK